MKIGIVGSGMISGHHLTAATRYGGAEIVGIVDRDLARAQAQAARFGVNRTFSDITELLALKPDVVHILTPPGSHTALTIQALEAGAHVYVEKPMALTTEDCELMTRAAVRANRQICVGHCWLQSPAVQRALQIIESGAAGDVLQASSSFNFDIRRNASYGQGHWAGDLPGGLAEDLLIHPASLLIRVLGAPQRIYGVTRSAPIVPNGGTADARAVLESERGLGSLSVSLRARPDMALLDVWCERMLLRVNISSMTLTLQRELPVPQKIGRGLANLHVASQLVTETVGTVWKLVRKKVDGSYGIVPLIHAFYKAIETGQPAPVGPAEGTQSIAVMRALWSGKESAPANSGRLGGRPNADNVRPVSSHVRGKRALVTGATGFVGTHLVRQLLERGYAVRTLARSPARAATLQSLGAEIRIGDLGRPESLAHIADDIDVVFHLGSAMYGNSEVFERVDLQGTDAIISEATRSGVRRIVFAGTLAAYPLGGRRAGSIIDETCPFDTTGLLGNYARAKVRAEEAVFAAGRAGKVEAVVLRLGLVCGEGAGLYPAHVCQKLPGKRVVLYGNGQVPLPLTFIDNAVDALILGAEVPGISGESFNIVDDDVLTQEEYLRLLQEVSGGTPKVLRMPRLAYYALGLATELAAAARRKEPATTRYRIRNRLAPVRWDCAKAKRMLNWHPNVPLADGLRRAFNAALGRPTPDTIKTTSVARAAAR